MDGRCQADPASRLKSSAIYHADAHLYLYDTCNINHIQRFLTSKPREE